MGRPTRTFGTATYVAASDEWRLEVEPHVAMKLKQVFGKIRKRAARELSLTATEENCRDLEWFTERYPLKVEGLDVLESRARAFDRTSEEAWSIVEGTYEAPPRATEMTMPPRTYQEQAALLCHTLGGLLLADDLGLGKTVSGIALLAQQGSLPALVVVPTHLQVHWKEQCAKFVPELKAHIAKTKKPYPLAKDGERPPDVLVCTYTKLSGWEAHVAGWAKTVIFDECQELRRGSLSAKYKAARNVAQEASYRLGLSATPIYNYGVEFWNVLDVLRPGALGTVGEFVREWCSNSYDQTKARIQDPKAFGTYLREQGMMLRRTKRDVGRELPDVTQIVEEVDSDAKVLDGAKDAASELARIILSREASTTERWTAGGQFDTKLRQVTGLAKAPYVAEFVRMLVQENQEQVVVFGWHRECFAAGTKVLMYNGTSKSVEEVCVGDQVMGPDSTPRTVRSLVQGHGRMYKVVPNKGDPWECSANHILTVWNGQARRHEKWTVEEFASRSPRWQRDRTLYRAEEIRYPDCAAVVEPWLLGYWLGDGAASLQSLRVCSSDTEVKSEVHKIAARNGLKVSIWDAPGASGTSNAKHLSITSGLHGSKNRNRLKHHFRSLGLHKNKHIPHSYAVASVEDRRDLLAGLLDSDGHVHHGNGAGSAGYSSKNRGLANQVASLARSLGLAAYVSEKTSTSGFSHPKDVRYYVTNISGDLTKIPTRIERKRAPDRAGHKSVLRTGFRVEPTEDSNFYGFELDGDHLFLLDDFTVVHNCYSIWMDRLKAFNPVMFTGSESSTQKQKSLEAFKSGESKVLLMSLRSGSGVDGLQHVSSSVVIGELDWSPGAIEQCVGRVWRDGQDDPVFVYYLTARDGADPVMIDVLGVKRGQIDPVRDPTQGPVVMRQADPDHVKKMAEAYMRRITK